MGSVSKSYWVAAKLLQTGELKRMPASDLFRITVHGQNDIRYAKFRPKDVNDFDDKEYCGVLQADLMYLYNIMGMAETEQEIKDRVCDKQHPKRIRNKKRLSAGPTFYKLSELKCDDEIQQSKEESKGAVKTDKKKGQKSMDKDIMKSFLSKKKQLKAQHGNNSVTSKVSGTGQANSKAVELTKVSKPLIREKLTPKFPVESERDGFLDEESSDSVTLEDREETEEPSVKLFGKKPCSGNCALANYLKEQLQVKDDEIKKLEFENRKAADGFAKQLEAWQSLLTSEKNKETDSPRASPVGLLNSDVIGVPLIDETCDIPPGKIHIGDGEFVDAKKISDNVECKTFDFRKRVALLLEEFFPADLHLRSLEPKAVKSDTDLELLPISNFNIDAMTSILKNMKCSDLRNKKGDDITERSVRETVRRHMYHVRANYKISLLPAAERDALIAEKKAKAKKLREAAKERKEKRTNSKRSKKKRQMSSSSEEETRTNDESGEDS